MPRRLKRRSTRYSKESRKRPEPMSAPTQDRGALICALRGWIERLEAGGSVDAPPALSELLQPQEQAFYRQVAELTRRLHTAVVEGKTAMESEPSGKAADEVRQQVGE